jgi:hypothetical protein
MCLDDLPWVHLGIDFVMIEIGEVGGHFWRGCKAGDSRSAATRNFADQELPVPAVKGHVNAGELQQGVDIHSAWKFKQSPLLSWNFVLSFSAAAQLGFRLAPVSHEGACQSFLRRQKEEKEGNETAKK